jgi:dolichol-phosphate mannosyltransferase
VSDSLVIIPTYNEKENIEKMIDTVFHLSYPFHLLIVDDGSPDGTAAIVRSLQQKYPDQLHLLERSGKLGLGTAYLDGFRWGLKRPENYAYFFEMDADFSHTPADLIRCAKPAIPGEVTSR